MDIFGIDTEALLNKGIDAWVDVEQAKHTQFVQPTQVTNSDGLVYATGKQASPVAAGGVNFTWLIIGAVALGGMLLLARR